MDEISLDQVYDWILKAYEKAQEKGLPLTSFVFSLIGGVLIWAAIYGAKNGLITYLKDRVFGGDKRNSNSDSKSSPVCPRPKKQQKLDIQGLLDQVCKEAFPNDKESYNRIREMIENTDELNLLENSMKDLCQKLGLEDRTEKDALEKFRVDIRLKVFQMTGPIEIERHINTFDWNNVCQLLEEHIIPNSKEQRVKWYKYIEEEGIDGALLVTTKNIMEDLGFKKGQKKSFRELMKKLGFDLKDTGRGGITVADRATVAQIQTGGIIKKQGNISATGSRYSYGYKQTNKKNPEQQDDQTDTD